MRCRCGHRMAEFHGEQQLWFCWGCQRYYHQAENRWEEQDAMNVCTIDGCDAPVHARGLCMKHYRRRLRTGKTDDPKPSKCRLCGRPTNARGLCMQHYQGLRRMAIKRGLSLDEVMPQQ